MKRPLSHIIYFCIFVVGMIVLFTGVFTFILKKNQMQVNRKHLPWMISKPAGKELQGYASDISVTPGQTIKLFINSTKAYSAEIYRMGYYNGSGAKLMKQLPVHPPVKQTAHVNPKTMDANWKPVQTLKIPTDWPSGFYLIKLIATNGKGSYIPFVIHEKNPSADFAVLLATNTYEAYNGWGGKSLYTYNSSNHKASYMVSFNRPFDDENGSGQFFKFEYNLVRWLEKNNYNITYITDTDIDEGILNRSHIKTLIIAGHSEYWSSTERREIQSHTEKNLNLATFGANVGYWKVRFNKDDNGNPNRIMICYKNATQEDPVFKKHPLMSTGKFIDPPFREPEEEVIGNSYNGIPDDLHTAPLVVSSPDHWIYKGTGLKKGDKIYGVIGGEINQYKGRINAKVDVIAHSPVQVYKQKRYSDVVWGVRPSGTKFFATGTFLWSWFLDPFGHENLEKYNPNFAHADPRIQQMTKNVLDHLR